MDETGTAGQRTGTFTGKVAGDALVGTWTSTKGDRRLPITAHQTSEIMIGSKREILTQAIGTLRSIASAARAAPTLCGIHGVTEAAGNRTCRLWSRRGARHRT